MAFRVLMVGNDQSYLSIDYQMLRTRGFRVYLSSGKDTINDMIDEIKPDLVFINSKNPNKESTDLYHELIDNVVYATIPVIFTLAEDDVYLVNRKRTEFKDRRYNMSDNILDAIKMAFLTGPTHSRKRVRLDKNEYGNIYTAYRA